MTANLRHFPAETLALHDIEAQHPDAFILGILTASPSQTVATLRRLRHGLNKPTMTPAALLAAMSRQGLSASADALGGSIDAL